jgi:type IV secretory pathway VirB10-like protein
MIMKILRVLAGLAVVSALSLSVHAQSLGDAAREARAEKPATPQTKVFTNDNLPTTGSISVLGTAAPTPSASSSDKAAKPAAATAPDPAAKQKEADKIKDQIESQKGEISRLERELDISTREWKLRQAAYYADAGNQLRDPAAWAATERKYNDETAAKKQALDDARQKLDDLQDQARKAGMSSSATE